MDKPFERALQFVLDHEGGWSDHPQDPGGATMRGITLATYRAWCASQGRPEPDKAALRNITPAEVRAIYQARYWQVCRCDELPPALALLTFDMAVNAGPGRGVRILQQAVGAGVDGLIGPLTIAAARRAAERRPIGAVEEYGVRRALYYASLPIFGTFGLGWLRRTMAAQTAALALTGA